MVHSLSNPVRHWPIVLALFAALAALAAQAQSTPRAAKADPLDAAASVPAVRYTSSFAQYRGLRDQQPVEPSKVWREANDTVARIGGWRAYAREAQQPASAALPASAPASAPKLGGTP